MILRIFFFFHTESESLGWGVGVYCGKSTPGGSNTHIPG